MNFQRVVGHSQLKSELGEAIRTDQLPHAIMLSGKSGYGTLPMALAIATQLLEGRTNDDEPLTKAEKLIHPDLHFAYPVVKKDGLQRKDTTAADFLPEWRSSILENPYLSINEWLQSISKTTARGDMNVRECSNIIQQLGLQAFQGGKKIQLIWMCEYLGNNANKLLKLIEEPPANTHLILITENEEDVLNTIRSRCRIIQVKRIDDNDIADHLKFTFKKSEDQARQISFLAEGDLGLALEYLSLESNDMLAIGANWLKACQSDNSLMIRDWVDQFDAFNIEEKKAVIYYLLKVMREVLHWNVIGEGSVRLGPEVLQFIKSDGLIKSLRVKQIESIHSVLSDTIQKLQRNIHPKILLFNSSLQIESVLNKHVSIQMSE